MSRMQLLVFLGASGVCALALAHPGGAPHADLQAGLVHPFAGLDHAVAALVVGWYAAGLIFGIFALHALGFAGEPALHRAAPSLWRGAGIGVACMGVLLLAR